MSMKVFANGREVAGKASDGKSIACFPDVCISPPPPIAGPVPIPYPNTAMASDTTSGSKTVKLHGKEAMLKDKSFFKKSTGDEPATRNFGAGVITHQITGKVYFASFSMDVFIEGENVVRHLDLTTHNHGSVPGNTATWPYLANADIANGTGDCKDEMQNEKDACQKFKPDGRKDLCKALGLNEPKTTSHDDVDSEHKDDASLKKAVSWEQRAIGNEPTNSEDYNDAATCMQARRCQLAPYKPSESNAKDTDGNKTHKKQAGCCPSQTPHHMLPASALFDQGRGGSKTVTVDGQKKTLTSIPLKGTEKYRTAKAPCICVEGTNQNHASHGKIHAFTTHLMNELEKQKSVSDGKIALDSGVVAEIKKMKSTAVQLEERGDNGKHFTPSGSDLKTKVVEYGDARNASIASLQTLFPGSNCSTKCLKAQMDAYHNDVGVKEDTKVKAVFEGGMDVSSSKQKKLNARLTKMKKLASQNTDIPQ